MYTYHTFIYRNDGARLPTLTYAHCPGARAHLAAFFFGSFASRAQELLAASPRLLSSPVVFYELAFSFSVALWRKNRHSTPRTEWPTPPNRRSEKWTTRAICADSTWKQKTCQAQRIKKKTAYIQSHPPEALLPPRRRARSTVPTKRRTPWTSWSTKWSTWRIPTSCAATDQRRRKRSAPRKRDTLEGSLNTSCWHWLIVILTFMIYQYQYQYQYQYRVIQLMLSISMMLWSLWSKGFFCRELLFNSFIEHYCIREGLQVNDLKTK